MKRIYLPFIFLIIMVIVFVLAIFSTTTIRNTGTRLNRITCHFYDFNTLQVTAADELVVTDIEIKRGNLLLFSKGKQVGRVGQNYGRQHFKVYYQKKLV